jgi:AraC-like DNA-binding protein
VPVDIVEFQTTDESVVGEILAALYAPGHLFRYSGGAGRPLFRFRSMQAGELHGSRLACNLSMRVQGGPFHEFVAATVVAGAIRWQTGGAELSLGPGDVVRHPTDTGVTSDRQPMEHAVVRIPMAAVAQLAEASAGVAAADLRFDALTPVSAAMARRWRRLNAFVHEALDAPDSMADAPLVRAGLVDMVAAAALTVFPNTTMRPGLVPGPGQVSPAALRRAVAYVEEHAAEPVTVHDIAEAARVTPRALNAGFRRHFGTTVTGYLRRVRLERAHQDLLAADPFRGDTVSAVAARWGFGQAGRFRDFYRERYGVLPSRTLRA